MSGRFTKPPSWPRPSFGSELAGSKPVGSKPAPASGPDPRWPADWQLGVPRPEPRWPSSSPTVPAGFPRVPAARPVQPTDADPPGVAAGAPLAAATAAPGRPVTPASPPSLTSTLLEIGSPAPAPTRVTRPTPARMFGWGSLGLVLLVVAGFTVDGLATPSPPLVDSTQATTGPRATERQATDQPTDGRQAIHRAIDQAAAGTALAEVGRLKIRRPNQGDGFTWSQFGSALADTDGNGCDQRADVLRRDLTESALQPGTHGCAVATGVLHDPYTGRTISYRRSASSGVRIDHVVSLADAWRKGAAGWSAAKRAAFTTDPLNLLAVSALGTAGKGDSDATRWLPEAQDYRCRYVARQVAVKDKYGIGVSRAEEAVIARILTACPVLKPPGSTEIG